MRSRLAGLLAALAATVLVLAAVPAQAGRSCLELEVSPAELARRVEWAVQIRTTLERLDPEVALIARVGSDVSAYGLRYTHVGFVMRDHPKGRWLMVHLLNTCGASTSALYDQGLLNFLLDDPFALDVLILELPPRLQRAVAERLRAGHTDVFRAARYSTVAYPFSTRYQNSNQWLLEVLAAAQADLDGGSIDDRAAAQAELRRRGYRGTVIHLSAMQQIGALLTRSNIAFDDHPGAARAEGRFETVTMDSIRSYLARNGDLARQTELIYPHPELFEKQAPRRDPPVAYRDDRP